MAKKKKGVKDVTHPIALEKRVEKAPWWLVPAILLFSFIVFIPALKAGFVAWDDGVYVYGNPLIKDWSHLKELLTTPFAGGNHHPLTMLTLAINYQISGEDAWSYHLFNIVFHLINCFLVFRLAMLLSNKNSFIAFTTAILFGIHPMHVESVAWVSERKDVLFGMFFLAGLISYTKYADEASRKQYLLTILFLILSLLSKPAAVTFPFALLCIDFLRKRKWSFRLIVEKLPFFILCFILGLITFFAQRQAGAVGEEYYPLGTRILFGFYGVMMYIIKMFLPFKLAPFYPFPSMNESLPSAYYAGPLFFIAIAVLFFYSFKRDRVIAFGILFYLSNLVLVLQVLQVGMSIISERYTYIPYIGLFYALGWIIFNYTKPKTSIAYAIIFPIALLFAILAYRQSGVWYDSATLWENAIKTQPSAIAFTGKAIVEHDEKNLDQAVLDYSEAIRLNSAYYEAYTRRANIYMDQNKLQLSYNDYRAALTMKPDNYSALAGLGGLLGKMGQYDSSLYYLNKAVALNPDQKLAYKNRAITFMQLKRNEEAIKDFEKFLQFEPGSSEIYNAIGSCYQALGKYQESLSPLSKAIELNPVPAFFLSRCYSFIVLKRFEEAKHDALTAKQGGIQIPLEYARTLGIQ